MLQPNTRYDAAMQHLLALAVTEVSCSITHTSCIVPGSHHWPICRMLTPRYWAHPEAGGRRFPAHSAWLPVTNCCIASARSMRNPSSEFARRSEEHTSELQSLMRISYAVFCL